MKTQLNFACLNFLPFGFDHRRTGQHPFGGQTEFCPNGFGGGGGVVAEIFRDQYSVGWQNFSVDCSSRPSICVILTCIVFCLDNVDSLPEFMSTNFPNWGGQLPPPRPVRLWTMDLTILAFFSTLSLKVDLILPNPIVLVCH